MSRRGMIILAVFIVTLYFCVILFMLTPLQSAKNVYFHGNLMTMGQGNVVNWCQKLRWQSPPSRSVVALVSHPGSGNTWLRYLLQQATGILTGSVYLDYGLRSHGFPGENVTDGSVLAVKTHEGTPRDAARFTAAILLIRNPRDAILADFNRLHKGHVGTASKRAFTSHDTKLNWMFYVVKQLRGWEALHRDWLYNYPHHIHIVFYESLVRDTRSTLEGILLFLNHTVPQNAMDCAMANKEGIYRRKKKIEDFDPFTPEMYFSLRKVRERVSTLIRQYMLNHGIADVSNII